MAVADPNKTTEDEEVEESEGSVEGSDQLKEEASAEVDDGLVHDLSYFVKKISDDLEEKSDENASENDGIGGLGSDSEDDVAAGQPVDGDTLRPPQMPSLQFVMKKSHDFRDHRLRLGKTICAAPYRNFLHVDCIADFKFLRCVDFGRNFLRDLTPFTELPFLGTLKLYGNGIWEVASLKSETLRFLDLSHNKLANVEGATLPRISRLKLNFNRIRSFDFFKDQEIKWLRRLELRGNGLKSTAGIRHPFLEELYLAENDIRKIEGLEFCPSLKRLHLRDNQITEVTGFSKRSAKLEYVNFRNNLITLIEDAVGVSILPRIKTLIMLDNPVQLEKDFRTVMIVRIPTLSVLDKEVVGPYDRDWSIMMLLDCLYHEQVDLMVAVGEVIDTLPPLEMSDTALDGEKSLTAAGSSGQEDATAASLSDEDDDLSREYWGEKWPEPEAEGEQEEEREEEEEEVEEEEA